MKHPDFGLATLCMAIPTAISMLFIYCYYGKIATESYEKMSDCLYECNWIDLSPGLQKSLVIMIGNAQQLIYYHGTGIAVLNLGTFTQVSKNQKCL